MVEQSGAWDNTYDALGTHGLVYNIDLETPFLDIADDKSAFDTVKYPGDMLRDKIGDCDDLTALYGSLLANLGIETMFQMSLSWCRTYFSDV